MRIIKKLVVSIFVLLYVMPTYSYTTSSAMTYNDITWSVSTSSPLFTQCNQLRVSLTGASNAVAFSSYGGLNCPSNNTSYIMYGTLYIDISGKMNASWNLGIGAKLHCLGLANFSGSCTIYDSNGNVVGSAYLAFNN